MEPNPSNVVKFGPYLYRASQTISIANWKACFKTEQPLTFPAFRCEDDPATDRPVEWKMEIRPKSGYCEHKIGPGDSVTASVTAFMVDKGPSYRISVSDLTVRLEGQKDGKSVSKSANGKHRAIISSHPQEETFLTVSLYEQYERWQNWQDVKVKCDIEYINGYTVQEAPSKTSISTTMVDATLPENFLSMLDSGNGTDVTFCLGGAKIPAHRAILSARSNYFRRMFDAGMKEAVTGVINVKDVDADIFRRLLHFIYGGVLPQPSKETATQLLAAAERYCLEPLKESCAQAIADDVTVENVCEILMLADTHACPNLKKKCVETIKKNLKTIAKQEAWKEVKKDLALVAEIMDAITE